MAGVARVGRRRRCRRGAALRRPAAACDLLRRRRRSAAPARHLLRGRPRKGARRVRARARRRRHTHHVRARARAARGRTLRGRGRARRRAARDRGEPAEAEGACGGVNLLDYRDRFPILEQTTYLINHSLGAMPAAVEERMHEYARTWAQRGIRAWGEGWWTLPLTVGDQIARIVGAPPGTVCMHQNVSVAEAVILSCFQSDERRKIVYERENFPSVRYVYQARRDLEVVATDDVLGAIDEQTLLVPTQHVLFKSGEIQDVEAIVARAHEVGAYVVLDAYQSAGTVPLDVPALYAATPGFDLIEEIGVERIRANSLRQTQLLIDGADTRGFEVRSPREPARRGGTVTVHVPDFEAVHRELGERQILCDFRPGAGIRLGPHYFTSDEELGHALDQIEEILATGAHERWLGATARF